MRSEARKHQAWVEDKVDEEIDKKGQVEKADETKQNVEYTLPINTCANSIEIPNVFAKKNKLDEVIAREKYKELDVKKQKADDDNTLHQHHQRQEQEHQRVRQGVIARDRTEEVAVEKQNAGNDAPTAFKNIRKKTDEVVARNKFEELNVLKQNADDDHTQRQHHHHHQEQARRV